MQKRFTFYGDIVTRSVGYNLIGILPKLGLSLYVYMYTFFKRVGERSNLYIKLPVKEKDEEIKYKK